MIVTCPACQTRYLVDEAALGGDGGRRVRCASCGNLWRYSAEAAAIHQAVAAITAELSLAQAEASPARPAAAILPSATPPAPALRAEPGTQAAPFPAAVAPPMRPPVTPPILTVRRPPAGGAWLTALALLALLLLVAVLGRDELIALYPPLAPLYHRLHLATSPANAGLQITSTVTREADTLTVAGDIVNNSEQPLNLSRLRVMLRDGSGHTIETRIIAPPIARLPSGLTVYYSTTFERPSITVAGAEVAFAGD